MAIKLNNSVDLYSGILNFTCSCFRIPKAESSSMTHFYKSINRGFLYCTDTLIARCCSNIHFLWVSYTHRKFCIFVKLQSYSCEYNHIKMRCLRFYFLLKHLQHFKSKNTFSLPFFVLYKLAFRRNHDQLHFFMCTAKKYTLH